MNHKRMGAIFLAVLLATAVRAQDSATEQRLNELSGKLEELIASQEAQRKQIDTLAKEIRTLHEKQSTPTVAYASQEDLRHLAETVRDIDRKRLEDNEKIRAELVRLGKTLSAPLAPPKKSNAAATDQDDKPPRNESGFEYVVQKNDTLSLI